MLISALLLRSQLRIESLDEETNALYCRQVEFLPDPCVPKQ